ncbi:hypothetical protein ES708_02406 [subsurface metagenome]
MVILVYFAQKNSPVPAPDIVGLHIFYFIIILKKGD